MGGAGNFAGSIIGGVAGAGAAHYTMGRSRLKGKNPPPTMDQYTNSVLGGMENALMSYDDLVSMGRLRPGQNYFGLTGGQSRISRGIQNYEQSLAEADPAFASWQKAVRSGMEGLENGGIPSDMQRTILENLRESQASRGILDSNNAAVEEVVRLMGGSEAIRAQRMGEVQDYFGSVTSRALDSLLPSASNLLGLNQQSLGLQQQRYFKKSDLVIDSAQIGAEISS